MRALPKPQFDPESVFAECISRVRNNSLKRKLKLVKSEVGRAAQNFDAAARNNTFHTLTTQKNVNGVDATEMIKVYTDRMAKPDSPGRHIYEQLLAAPPNKRCPLCGAGMVRTLDHYLPKADFPALAVVPWNLVPSCRDCNSDKLSGQPANPGEATLHPYYDGVLSGKWLYAEIDPAISVLTFMVRPPASWDPVLKKRVASHFKVFALGEKYASIGAEELTAIKLILRKMLTDNGPTEGPTLIADYLADLASGHLTNYENDWKTALYNEISENSWYHQGGFENW